MELSFPAADSLGTRSMATLVETRDCRIFIDPAAALGPRRYGRAPHRKELERLDDHISAIEKAVCSADILVVTHYHYDHYRPEHPEWFAGKTVYLKHPRENINKSQMGRSSDFLRSLEPEENRPAVMEFSDGRAFRHGDTEIIFSEALPHGFVPRLGYVTSVCVRDRSPRGPEKEETRDRRGNDHPCRCFLHTSDVQGLPLPEQTDFILGMEPEIVYLDGPLFGLPEQCEENIGWVLENAGLKDLVIDHHFLRNGKWKELLKDLYGIAAESGCKLRSAAEYSGSENDLLEARRKDLYADDE